MRVYTKREIEEEIRIFEGFPDWPANGVETGARFLRGWEETYQRTVRSFGQKEEDILAHIKIRWQHFTENSAFILPEVDRYPEEGFRFTIYGIINPEADVWRAKGVFLEQLNNPLEFTDSMAGKYKEQYGELMFVHSHSRGNSVQRIQSNPDEY